jgi:YVTN family beta-propeller protein
VVSLLRRSVAIIAAALLVACGSASSADAPVKVHIGVHASFVLSGGGSVWATDPVLNRVVRVDPATNRIKARLAVPNYPFGLVFGSGSLWVGSRYGSQVTRFNARTNKRQARIRVGSAPYALAYGAGAVWVTNENDGTVSRIGPKRNKVVKTIRVGGKPNGIAVAFGSVWVADYGRGRLIRLNPATNKVSGRIVIPTADWITRSGDSLWVSSETGKVYRVDPARLVVKAAVTVGANPLASAVIGGELWVPNIDANTVSVLDTAASSVKRTIDVGKSPIAVASAAGAAWVSSEEEGDLWRLSPSAG